MDQPVIDYTEEPEEVLIDLINIYNQTRFSTGHLFFGMPQILPGANNPNTSLVVYAKKFSGYKGQVTIRYQRLEIATQVSPDESTVFDIGSAVMLSDLIPAINTQLGVNLNPTDFLDAQLQFRPGGETNTYQQALTMLDYSLLYKGTLMMTIRTNEIALKDVVVKPVLSAFAYTPPT
jgi:hypothetical protein